MTDNIVYIRLEDDTIIKGRSFGAILNKHITKEIVFQTGMVGYTESLTDPSYKDQFLVLTYPMIGNYGVPSYEKDANDILRYHESDKIQPSALIVNTFEPIPSSFRSNCSIDQWLKDNNTIGIYDVDTRELVKIIRDKGTMHATISTECPTRVSIPENIILADVSNNIRRYNPGKDIHVFVIDCGMKNSQLRNLLKRDVSVTVAPYTYDFNKERFNRLFISNGPGNPEDYIQTINNLRAFMENNESTPIFGICLGHQLLSLAINAKTYKMPYGNRGHNIPCRLANTNLCYITSQNHGYAVDHNTIPEDWNILFTNINDNSNEGIIHKTKPYFTTQFHPESYAGPNDTNFLFKIFIENTIELLRHSKKSKTDRKLYKKVLILGSGGLAIGQSGEFDYSGSQAIKAFNEEGLKTVLINPNVATVQTTPGFADKVYYLPVTPDYVKSVIKQERPDCIALSFGGQTALNTGIELQKMGILDKYNIDVLGTEISSIIKTEDRDIFKNVVQDIGESIPDGMTINIKDRENALGLANKIGYPLLVRSAFSLGGLGSGFAHNDNEYMGLVNKAFSVSPQIIIDKSLKGWKEVEYEVVRDRHDNCITVCNMENLDPLGVHTGESIVVAPSQTLDNHQYNMLRDVSIKMIRYLNIIGECNIQFALNPESDEYYIIEVNARLSRSSALASKATGYPLAYIAAKLCMGYSLFELKNNITKKTSSCFEPSLDYCVVKIPRWDLQKFAGVDTHIGSAMKSIGEVMGIGRTFEEAFHKALRSAHSYEITGYNPFIAECSDDILYNPTNDRIFAIANGLYTGIYTVDDINRLSGIDKWFLNRLNNIIIIQKELEENILTKELLLKAKKIGLSDKYIAKCCKSTELVVRKERNKNNIHPYIKQIDTVAGEFPCYTNYLYSTYNADYHDIEFEKDMIIVLGSGVYKIGSSVEFDWCAVNCIKKLKNLGKKVIMINHNPETVSTDYDEADRLYFEELSFESVMDIYELEDPIGVILSVGGQLPNNIAMQLYRQKVRILGTSPEMIDQAENRYKFSRMLDSINVDQPRWRDLTSIEDAKKFCNSVNYPCLIRPSYVLSGAAMNVAYNDKDLESYLGDAVAISKDYPVVISRFITDAKEIEVDAVAHNGHIVLLSIAEHVENAGVHSGDATLILPPYDITKDTMNKIRESTHKISEALNINGPFNIQFIAKDNMVKVIECNLRVSRTFPFVSKTLDVNFIKVATQIMVGISPKNIDTDILLNTTKYGVKVAQFSFNRLPNADIKLGVDMVSTGEVACFGKNHYDAFLKAYIASGFSVPTKGILLSIGSYKFKKELLNSVKILERLNYKLYGTTGTADFYKENNIDIVELVNSNDSEFSIKDNINNVDLVINISKPHKIVNNNRSDGYKLRRLALDNNIHVITDIKKTKLLISSIAKGTYKNINTQIDCFTAYDTVRIPGLIDVHVHVREPGATYKEDWESCTRAAIAGGVTMICAMPNTDPPIIDEKSFNDVLETANRKAHCDYAIFVGANSDNYNDIYKLSDRSAALKMYLNATYGPLLLEKTTDWIEHVQNWPEDRPLCVHAEAKTLPAILHICNLYNKRVHVCHVARKEEIEVIKVSKLQGMKITCEVAPHHLFLDVTTCSHLEENLVTVKPPIVHKVDRQALWDNIDIIDCFATDHAPHTIDDKLKHNHPGFPGLETALPLLLTAVKQGKLTLDDIIEKYHTNPKKIFNLPDQPDTYVEISMNHEWTVPKSMKYSKCGWTPFAGMNLYGIVKRTVLNGKVVYVDGEVLSTAGYGNNVRPDTFNNSQKIMEKSNILSLPKEISTNKYKKCTILDNIYSVHQFTRDMLRDIFSKASYYKNKIISGESSNILQGKILSMIFYEPSTRTRCSFDTAMKRLGGKTVSVDINNSSAKKGESLKDYIKCMECYADCILLRTSSPVDYKELIKNINVPIINCGDGIGEHPTQALLDLYTMREEIGTVTGKTITFVGDLKNGRTIHSLVKLLCLYKDVRFCYVPIPGLDIPLSVKNYVKNNNLEQYNYDSLDSIIKTTDILYMTRVQKERFNNEVDINTIILTPDKMTDAKEDMIVMHPLPRNEEISKDIDEDPRAAYFRQMKNGMYIRMALLDMIMQKN